MSGIVKHWGSGQPPSQVQPRMQISIAEFPLRNEQDVKSAAQRARLLGTLVSLADRRRTAFGRAVREIARNAVQHVGSGQVEFRLETDSHEAFVRAVVSDGGTGREEIESILADASGADCGLRRAAAWADGLQIESIADGGKKIRISIAIPLEVAGVSDTDVAEWAGILRTRRIQNALASTQRRSRELAEQLTGIQRQRQQLEVELHQSQSLNETLTLLSLVASKTDNAVIIMDGNGLTTWVNDAFIRMTGYAVQDAVGARPDHLLAGPDTSKEALRELEHALQLGHGVSEELLQYRREGTTSWISLSLTPIHDDQGTVTRWIGIGADITKRREAQKALETARDAAEKASRLKGDFLANMSHEIRTPMNAIIGMTDLTLCTSLNEDQQEYLTTVKQSAEALLELLNDVLDLSKIESGRLEIDENPFHLRSVVADTLKPLNYVAEQKELRLTWSIASDIPAWIIGDALRLRQILVNLAGNAIKFTATGYVEVTVQKQWESGGEIGLQFTVADTGKGIPANKLDRIFEAFTQADSSITRQFGGTGLGLAISAELLRLMKGRIWVQSEEGKGSRFHFSIRSRLPTEAETVVSAAARQASTSQARSNPFETTCQPLKILVADDHPANRQLIAKILEKRGHSVSFAKNGHDVLSLFDQTGFDVVLMDVQMPEMDGYQATAAIRQRERESHTHVPIIAVTAHAMQGDRETCLAAGMDAYLSKPISAVEIVTLVESLSDNQVNVSVTSATATGFVALDESAPDKSLVPDTEPSTVNSGNSPVRDFRHALERLDNDEELLREQMQFFLKDGPELLNMVQKAVENQDGGTLQIAAHRLKNLCATFDDNDSATLCSDMEYLGRDGRFDAANDQQDSVVQGVRTLLETIRRY